MFLAIDIGNTNITLGVFEGESVGTCLRFATDRRKTADEYGLVMLDAFRRAGIAAEDISGIAIASVSPMLTPLFREICRNYLRCDPFVVDGATATGIRCMYDDPQQVGADRIVDAAAAYKLYGGPACVIDFGTATTFDAVSAAGEYLGGAIVPGIVTASDALFQHAARLSKVDLRAPRRAIGRNITQSLQSGILYGYVGLVEGMIARFRVELGADMKTIATGGLSQIIAGETKEITVLAPWLMLEGLRIIYEMNFPK